MNEWLWPYQEGQERYSMPVESGLRNATAAGLQVRVTASSGGRCEFVAVHPRLGDPVAGAPSDLDPHNIRAVEGDVVYFPHHKAWVCITDSHYQQALQGTAVIAGKKAKGILSSARCCWAANVPVETMIHYLHLRSAGHGSGEPFRLWVYMWALRYYRAIGADSRDKLVSRLAPLMMEAADRLERSAAAPVDRRLAGEVSQAVADAVMDYTV